MSRVCAKHEEWCPEDVCRWCEPAPVAAHAAPPVPTSAQWGVNLNAQAAAQQNVASGILAAGLVGMCACGRFMVAGPGYRYFDGQGYLHTGPACQVSSP